MLVVVFHFVGFALPVLFAAQTDEGAQRQDDQVKPVEPLKDHGCFCPRNKYIDCMPPIREKKRQKMCSKNAWTGSKTTAPESSWYIEACCSLTTADTFLDKTVITAPM